MLLRDWNQILPGIELRLKRQLHTNTRERMRALRLLRALHEAMHAANRKVEIMRKLNGSQWRGAKRDLESRINEIQMLLQYCHAHSIPGSPSLTGSPA